MENNKLKNETNYIDIYNAIIIIINIKWKQIKKLKNKKNQR